MSSIMDPLRYHTSALPDVALVEKWTESGAGVLGVALRCEDDWILRGRCSGAAFPGISGKRMPDGVYTTITLTRRCLEDFVFTVIREGDMAHTFVFKAELVGPADLDALFDHFDLSTDGNVRVSVDLALNNALARAHGLWPSKNNEGPRRPDQKWVATIPLMTRETTAHNKAFLPLLPMHGTDKAPQVVKVQLFGVRDAGMHCALDVDYVYLDTPTRRWLARSCCCSDDTGIQSLGYPHKPTGRFITQHQSITHELTGTETSHRVPLDVFQRPVTGFILRVLPGCKVLRAALVIHGACYMDYDLCDLSEWNWLKCGMRPPSEDYSVLLMPVSREMFWGDTHDGFCVSPCTLNLSRIDTTVLKLDLAGPPADGLKVRVTALLVNETEVVDGCEETLIKQVLL